MLTKKQKKEYEEFSNKQFEVIKGHFDRCLLRCYNKLMELLNLQDRGNGKVLK